MEIKVLGSGKEVGRAAILLKGEKGSLLLDYGVSFNERDIPQFPLHVRPVDITALVISHAHLDHVGAAPYLFVTGNPKVVSTKPTLDIARLLIIDFLRLNAHYLDYELREFDRMYNNAEFLGYGDKIEVEYFSIQLFNAGHILGSSLVYVETSSDERVLYTGDFNTLRVWTLEGAEMPPVKPTTLIVESTYGARNHPSRHLVEKSLLEIVEDTIDKGGAVLIPAFSVGRTQEIMTMLYAQAPYLDIYVDGLSRDITELYLKYRKFLRDPNLFAKVVENINFVTDSAMRKRILKKPCVIIASAGMLKGGPSLYYLKHLHGSSRNSIVLVSYQAVNSNGHRIIENGLLEEHGIGEPIKARLAWLDFSSHAGSDDIVRFVTRYKDSVRNVVTIHGSVEDMEKLSMKLREKLGDDIRIATPSNGDSIKT